MYGLLEGTETSSKEEGPAGEKAGTPPLIALSRSSAARHVPARHP
jgi:hypothetical protein